MIVEGLQDISLGAGGGGGGSSAVIAAIKDLLALLHADTHSTQSASVVVLHVRVESLSPSTSDFAIEDNKFYETQGNVYVLKVNRLINS